MIEHSDITTNLFQTERDLFMLIKHPRYLIN